MFKIIISTLLIIALVAEAWFFKHQINQSGKVSSSTQKSDIFNHVPVDLDHEIQYMDHLNGYQFEDYTAWLLKWNGFVGIKQTGKNQDYGLDVLAYRHHQSYGIQCKHYKKRKIKRQVIKHTADGGHFYGVQHVIVLTNTRFSHEAIRSRKFFHVELWDRKALITLIKRAMQHYHSVTSKSRS